MLSYDDDEIGEVPPEDRLMRGMEQDTVSVSGA